MNCMRQIGVLGLLCSVVGCGDDADPAEGATVTLAALVPQSGTAADQSWKQAVDLAALHATEGLSMVPLKGLLIDMITRDDQGMASVGVERAIQLAQEDGAIGIQTGTSGVTTAILETHYDDDSSNDLNAVIMGCSSASPSLNNPAAENEDATRQATLRDEDEWFFRTLMDTVLVGKVMARALVAENSGDRNGDGVLRISFFVTDDNFGRGLRDNIVMFLEEFSTVPVEHESIPHPRDLGGETNDTFDWPGHTARVVDELNEDTSEMGREVDIVVPSVIGGFNVPIARNVRLSGADVRVFYNFSFRINSVLQELGSDAEGFQGVSHALSHGDSGPILRDELLENFGFEPVYRSNVYYDGAMTMILAAMVMAQELDDPSQMTGADLREGLKRINDPNGVTILAGAEGVANASRAIQDGMAINYDGPSGPIDFDVDGDVRQNLVSFEVQDGEYVDTGVFRCLESDDCAPE